MIDWKNTKCGTCKWQATSVICTSCNEFNKYMPMTNAMKIRLMSDEELADFLTNHHRHPCRYCIDCWIESGGKCKDALIRWLKSTVKE